LQNQVKLLVYVSKCHNFRKIITYVNIKIEFSNSVFIKIKNVVGSPRAVTRLLTSAEFVFQSPAPLTIAFALIPLV